jgi:hypothetical protein
MGIICPQDPLVATQLLFFKVLENNFATSIIDKKKFSAEREVDLKTLELFIAGRIFLVRI